jgi:UDPglucose 6-dehydrogenase
METARAVFGDRVNYTPDLYSALQGAEALVIVTEWLVYRNPDFSRIKSMLARPLVIDGRNLFDPARMAAQGFEYHGIGRRTA